MGFTFKTVSFRSKGGTMQQLLTSEQTRLADQYTIAHEPIASIDLMERASRAFMTRFVEIVPDQSTSILVCAGTGNNGGDGLAAARMLHHAGYRRVEVWIARFARQTTPDFNTNLNRLQATGITILELQPGAPLPPLEASFVIDALIGAGLNKPLSGDFLRLVTHINASGAPVIAMDIPTGLPSEGPIDPQAVTTLACETITFQRPKINFFFPESAPCVTRFHTVPIGLNEDFIQSVPTGFSLIERADITHIYRIRTPFSHKGTFGHALVVAGQARTMGAALLCAGASIHAGAGLTSVSIPEEGRTALNIVHPEAMYLPRAETTDSLTSYDAIAVGPGLGQDAELLEAILTRTDRPLVLDADALNTLATHPSYLDRIPKSCILTPHAKEFDRLFGVHANWWERVSTARERAVRHQIVIVLKNRFTFVATPNGKILVNPTGNPAMASGGMGDILTGMIVAFLAQGYSPVDSAVLACFLHGLAGDQLAKQGMAVIPASRLLHSLPAVIGTLTEQTA